MAIEFDVKFEISTQGFDLEFDTSAQRFELNFGEMHEMEREAYKGSYEVQSIFNEDFQMLTKNKKMTDDVTVKKIPYGEVTNPSGGKTITIG